MKVYHLNNTGIKKPRKKGTELDNTDYFVIGVHTFDPYKKTLSISVDFWEHEADALALKIPNSTRTVVVDSDSILLSKPVSAKEEVVDDLIISTALNFNRATTTSGDHITLKNATLIAEI
jgi:hypothetical protein